MLNQANAGDIPPPAADVLAKPLFGLLVLAIALAKSRDDGYTEAGDPGSATPTTTTARQPVRS